MLRLNEITAQDFKSIRGLYDFRLRGLNVLIGANGAGKSSFLAFLPYIQPYEFEALLFSDLRQFGATEPLWAGYARNLIAALREVESPEHLNDGPETHPSARLRALRPPYRKVFHGQLVADRIGLARIRAGCVHCNDWLTRLEVLEPL